MQWLPKFCEYYVNVSVAMLTWVHISISTQQIYSIVLEIKSSVAVADTRWTFFQAPFVVEDALGYIFPVPSEYDFDLLNAVVTHRFKDGLGTREVRAGDYELVNTNNSAQVISPNIRLLPGTRITIAIIQRITKLGKYTCPTRICRSTVFVPAPQGGMIWYV